MKKYIILWLIAILPVQVIAANGMTASETESMVTQMKAILDQYATRIKYLEVENAVLREEVRKAGIQIPLSAYSGAIIQTNTSTTITTPTTSTGTTTAITTTPSSASISGSIATLTTQYGARYAGFIARIHSEWTGIQWAYKLPTTAYIGGYEFVKQWSDNHVFVDIVYDVATATNAYDAKILYEYNTGTYQRKLVGFFELDRTTGYYKTRSGNNIFAWVARTFVRDPLAQSTVVPATATSSGTSTTTASAVIPTFAEIEKAYTDKRYLSVISLSNTYLTANTATYDLLRIRYRTYFIIGKYTESLAEIAKIESLGQLASVACDAQVIATYSKDTALITKYTNACK